MLHVLGNLTLHIYHPNFTGSLALGIFMADHDLVETTENPQ